jgi:salicylate hydroxylase
VRDQTYATVGLRGNPEVMNRLYGHDAEGATATLEKN